MKATPLLEMVLRGEHQSVAELLRRGANVNALGPMGMTALMIARDERMTALLLEYGGNVNAVDDAGATALMYQGEVGNSRAVNMLLEAGAEPNARDRAGRTALDRAKIGKLSRVSIGRDGHVMQHLFWFPRRGRSEVVNLLRDKVGRVR